MVQGSYGGASGSISGKEGLTLLIFIIAVVAFVVWYLKKTASDAISGTLSGIKSGLAAITETRTPNQIAQDTYKIASAGSYLGAPITGVAPSPTILAAMNRYYNTGEVKTYTTPGGTVWGIDSPSIDPAPISSETPSGYIRKRLAGDWFDTFYWVYGCDASGYNCTSSRKVEWYESVDGYRNLT